MRSADAARRAGAPRAYILCVEVEMLQTDIAQGRAKAVIPQLEEKLMEMRAAVELLRSTDRPAEPYDDILVTSFLDGLRIAETAYNELEREQKRLEVLREREQVALALGVQEEDELVLKQLVDAQRLVELATEHAERGEQTEANRKLGEAKSLAERCIEVFRQQDNLQNEGRAMSTLASVWEALGDIQHAMEIERQALALYERLPDPEDRADAHHNLAYYLNLADQDAEARGHVLAALIYRVASGLSIKWPFQLLRTLFQDAVIRGERCALPRLGDFISNPNFVALRHFLAMRKIDMLKLESNVDNLQDIINRSMEKFRAQIDAASVPAPRGE